MRAANWADHDPHNPESHSLRHSNIKPTKYQINCLLYSRFPSNYPNLVPPQSHLDAPSNACRWGCSHTREDPPVVQSGQGPTCSGPARQACAASRAAIIAWLMFGISTQLTSASPSIHHHHDPYPQRQHHHHTARPSTSSPPRRATKHPHPPQPAK